MEPEIFSWPCSSAIIVSATIPLNHHDGATPWLDEMVTNLKLATGLAMEAPAMYPISICPSPDDPSPSFRTISNLNREGEHIIDAVAEGIGPLLLIKEEILSVRAVPRMVNALNGDRGGPATVGECDFKFRRQQGSRALSRSFIFSAFIGGMGQKVHDQVVGLDRLDGVVGFDGFARIGLAQRRAHRG